MTTARGRDRPPVEVRVCRAIRQLAAGDHPDEVARAVRVTPATLASWQQADDFQALVKAARHTAALALRAQTLDDLLPDALDALRLAMEGDQLGAAVAAAREVLRYAHTIKQSTEQTITVNYANPENRAIATAPWADRHPATPGALQGRGVRETLWQDGDGQDSDDRAGADGPDLLVDQPELRDGA